MVMRSVTGTQYRFGGSGSESGSEIVKMQNPEGSGSGYGYVIRVYDPGLNTRDIA
jgi:hypothetical protein